MKNFCTIILIIILSHFTVSAQININSGLVACYTFSNNYLDNSGNGLHASNIGTSFTTDRFGNSNSALSFSGSSYLTLPNAARFQPKSSASLSFWLKTSQTTRFDLFEQRSGSASTPDNINFIVCYNFTGNYNIESHFSISPPNFYTSLDVATYAYNNSQWHHCVFIKNMSDSTLSFYVDNVLVGNKDIVNDTTFNVNGTLRIGLNYLGSYGYTGLLDDIRIYNRPLNNLEISDLFSNEHTAINEVSKNNYSADIFPNPATDKISLSLGNINNESISLSVYDLFGRVVLQKEYKDFNGQFNQSFNLNTPGVYFLNVAIGIQNFTKKFIVKN